MIKFQSFKLSPRLKKVSEGLRSCGWGCLSVTWPDDRLQQRHPASQKLKVCLQVVEHLQANVLSESSDSGGRGGALSEGRFAKLLVLGAARDCSCTQPNSFLEDRYGGSASPSPLHHLPNPTSDPCLKLTLPQASYSPWIPIIVSRIKTLSAKIFSASLIWCIPSPCEDRYSCQGKENKPEECSPQCKTWFCLVVVFFNMFSELNTYQQLEG